MKWIVVLFLLLVFSLPQSVFASSDYVLPYPSFMPGTIFYRPHLFFEIVSRYWYFGNFGQFKYNLKESDKYLVEAKTLFEYGQYLYADNSLKKSDEFFRKIPEFLIKAKSEGKDIELNKNILKSAAQKHTEVLKKISDETPAQFEWKPEKAKPTTIQIKKDLEDSIFIRNKYL